MLNNYLQCNKDYVWHIYISTILHFFSKTQMILHETEQASSFIHYKAICFHYNILCSKEHPGGASGKEFTCQWKSLRRLSFQPLGQEDPWSHNPLQYSCLENPMDRGAWWAIVHRVTKRQTWLKRLGTHART